MTERAEHYQGVGEEKVKGGGESQGGAYPNPHTGKKKPENDGLMGHGGQSEMGYHGTGQLGSEVEEVDENLNAPAKSD